MAIKKSTIAKMGVFFYRKKLLKMKTRYLDNPKRNSTTFAKYKSYRFILLEITNQA
jgi:hypothetical protein